MINNLKNNERFTTEYKNVAPSKGDLAAIYENNGRKLLMKLGERGELILPEAVQFMDYWIEPDDPDADAKAEEKGGRLIYLYSVGETNYYSFFYYDARRPDFSFTGMEFQPFNFDNRPEPWNEFFAAETGMQVANWYNDNKRCGRCGGRMHLHPKMRCLKCADCGFMIFPRINPTVIVAPIHDDKLLMIRYRGREEDGYAGTALIAGFMEIGETVEDTVRREVMEESGLKATDFRYYKSQPWGFGSNLLIGVICDIEGSAEIHINDTDEIAEAVWLSRDEIADKYRGVSLTNEMISWFKYGEDFADHFEI